MIRSDRRAFLKQLASGALGASCMHSIGRAQTLPANDRTRSIEDVEHIVILMQESRSFDHYFGMLQGVRGFNDPHVAKLPSGAPVWSQGLGERTVLPFRPDVPDAGAEFFAGLPHDWASSQRAADHGLWDNWVQAKGAACMAHMGRDDLPFHYALADAFTICDAYHCSVMGPTDPNRYHMWTGWTGNDGRDGGPVIDNARAGYSWATFPERLEAAGVSWQVYQDAGHGLNAANAWGKDENPFIGNRGDNALLSFNAYRDVSLQASLVRAARTGTHAIAGGSLLDDLRADIMLNALPQVSWIVAPEAFSEHPSWPSSYGAWYIAQVLDALTSRPEIWARTAVFLAYSENGGRFDHVIPPMPPVDARHGASSISTENEFYPGSDHNPAGTYGLGPRVPMLVLSPWSSGGWVNSEVFDHTSILRFIEARFGVEHPTLTAANITAWRRAVAGDLTSTFDFRTPNVRPPRLKAHVPAAPTDQKRRAGVVPEVPHMPRMPEQEPGTRPARALPYDLHVSTVPVRSSDRLSLTFENTGRAAAVFHVRDSTQSVPPRFYTVAHGGRQHEDWHGTDARAYDLEVFGPNGFFRAFRGRFGGGSIALLGVATSKEPDRRALSVHLSNHSFARLHVLLTDGYTEVAVQHLLPPQETKSFSVSVAETSGWYDVRIGAIEDGAFEVLLAGHLENDAPSSTDPAMGGLAISAPNTKGPFMAVTRHQDVRHR